MFIEVKDTPNPHVLQFLPGRPVLTQGIASFSSKEEAKHSPLALRLFALEGVVGVFLSQIFISVTAAPETDWKLLKPFVLEALLAHFLSEELALTTAQTPPQQNPPATTSEDSDIVNEIKELLDTRIRPAVAMDGGDIVFEGFDQGTVYVRFHGACVGCPSSSFTLKAGVERTLRYYIPEVKTVEII